MQTSGQFGVPPSEVPPQYNSVNNTSNNNSNSSNRNTSTPGSNQALGHMLFNLSNHDQQHPPLSSPASYSPHSAAVPLLLGKAGQRDGAQELFQDATPHQQQQQPNHHFSQFLQASAGSTAEHYQESESARQEQSMQQKQGNSVAARAPGAVQAHAHASDQGRQDSGQLQKNTQSMQLHHQLSLGLDQSMNEAAMPSPSGNNLRNMKASDNQLISADPISLGDIDQAEDGAGAGSRWPRQETLALLKIRADMDASFRDTSVKRPLWDEVSRKLGELGYDRSAKKCKEKFENVNKYYKRTKEGKVGRQDGKNYRFFTQLEALQTTHSSPIPTTINNNINSSSASLTPATMLISTSITPNSDNVSKFKAAAPSSADPSFVLPGSLLPGNTPSVVEHRSTDVFSFPSSTPLPPASMPLHSIDPALRPPLFAENASTAPHISSQSSSDDDDDDEDDDEDEDADDDDNVDDEVYDDPRPHSDHPHDPTPSECKKRKRKTSTSMMAFFEGLLKKVIDKQEQMQQKFLQALEKRETDRMIREEAWRRQEMVRLNKEHELRAQERSSAAARDAALISFLQKVTGQNVDLPATASTSAPIAAQPVQSAPPLHQDNAMQYEDQDASDPNSKRWLKPEVLALIELHSSLQAKFTEAGPKGPLWEEIANGMAKLGYSSRTAKRCKEKWENINKYFKRAKESNKKRPENAKTCPYFHELDALYRKGSLGASISHQVPYKPSIDHAQPHEDESVVHPPSTNNREGDSAHVPQTQLSIMPSDRVPASAAAASTTSNTGAAGTGDANNNSTADDSPATRNVNNNGGLQRKGSMQISMDAFGGTAGLNASSALDHTANNAPRSGFTAELGLNLQQQAGSMNLYAQKQVNQADFGKVTAGEEHAQADKPTQSSKESKPTLAPLPNSSSFMANMLQKLNGSSAAVNNNSTNQDQ